MVATLALYTSAGLPFLPKLIIFLVDGGSVQIRQTFKKTGNSAEDILVDREIIYINCNSFSLTQFQDRYIAANICPLVTRPLKRIVSPHTK